MNAATFRLGWLAPRSGGGSGPAVERAIWWCAALAVAAVVSTFTRAGVVGPSLVAVLVVAAALCVAILTHRRAPSVAWLAVIGGSYAASTLPITQARAADPGTVGVNAWMFWAVLAGIAALATLWIGLCYATRLGRRVDPIAVPVAIVLFAWLTIALATTLIGVAIGAQSDPAFTWVDVAVLPISMFSLFVITLVALGAAADVRAGVGRARGRHGPQQGAGRADAAWALAAATIRELVPGQTAAAEATVAAERTRLAGDLHASVLPGLRRAIAEAESGGDPDALARRLRTIDRELERLMADRWPVVLDAFGLVAALEDLAEQVEADGALQVEIDVERAGARPPVKVERAAWRVAQIAVDNAVRHAAATTITMTVALDATHVALAVADDGVGFDRTVDASIRRAARGLADANRQAETVGASLLVDRRPGGGTRVAFEWIVRP